MAEEEKVEKAVEEAQLMYKGRPVIRQGSFIYYGYQNEKYVCALQVMSTEELGDQKLSTKVFVQLEANDPTLKAKDRIIRKSEKDGLYPALDVAAVWLDRANAEK